MNKNPVAKRNIGVPGAGRRGRLAPGGVGVLCSVYGWDALWGLLLYYYDLPTKLFISIAEFIFCIGIGRGWCTTDRDI